MMLPPSRRVCGPGATNCNRLPRRTRTRAVRSRPARRAPAVCRVWMRWRNSGDGGGGRPTAGSRAGADRFRAGAFGGGRIRLLRDLRRGGRPIGSSSIRRPALRRLRRARRLSRRGRHPRAPGILHDLAMDRDVARRLNGISCSGAGAPPAARGTAAPDRRGARRGTACSRRAGGPERGCAWSGVLQHVRHQRTAGVLGEQVAGAGTAGRAARGPASRPAQRSLPAASGAPARVDGEQQARLAHDLRPQRAAR